MAVFYNGYEIKNVTLKMLYEVFEEAFNLEPQLNTLSTL